MNISQEGIDLIKEFEGFRSNAYRCPAGVVTIGIGTTVYANGQRVQMGDTITEKEAERELRSAIKVYEDAVRRNVTVPLTQGQFDALVSFTYNCGVGALEASTLLKKLNYKDYQGAANELPKWNKGGGRVLPGLVRRREAEKVLFLKSDSPLVGSIPKESEEEKATWLKLVPNNRSFKLKAYNGGDLVEEVELKDLDKRTLIAALNKYPNAVNVLS